eukprot:jgi/Ulvmu1/9315/UM050_0064.1
MRCRASAACIGQAQNMCCYVRCICLLLVVAQCVLASLPAPQSSGGCRGVGGAQAMQQRMTSLDGSQTNIEFCLDPDAQTELLWQDASTPLTVPANMNVTIQCNGAAISTFHSSGSVRLGYNSSLTFSNCNMTTGSSTARILWEEHSSPFASFRGDHTASVIMEKSVTRFTHSIAAILNQTGMPLLPGATAEADIGDVYTTGTGAWAATVNSAASFTRTLDIQFGLAAGPGIQQVFRDTVVWCAATWADSQEVVAALDTLGLPGSELAAGDISGEACSECCRTAGAAAVGRGRTVGRARRPPQSGSEEMAAVPVGAGQADGKTPSQQSGGGSVPRLVLILPLGVAAIALGVLLAVVLRPIIARARQRANAARGIDMHMSTSGAGASSGSQDAKAAAGSPGQAGRPRGARFDPRQHSIFLDSSHGGNNAPSIPSDDESSDGSSGSQVAPDFKVYENCSFSPTP